MSDSTKNAIGYLLRLCDAIDTVGAATEQQGHTFVLRYDEHADDPRFCASVHTRRGFKASARAPSPLEAIVMLGEHIHGEIAVFKNRALTADAAAASALGNLREVLA